jgi:hypothetical protein
MREIVEATGGDKRQTKYNIFKQLEAAGHKVRREGGRIFLEHKAGVSIEDDAGGAEEGPSGPITIIQEWTPALERYLQGKLRESLDKLEPGLVAIDGGREEESRDITARDRAGNIVVIEVWTGKAIPDKVCQLLGYMGKIKAAPSGLRGILVAADFRDDAVATASLVPTIALKRYNFVGRDDLTFETA